MASGLRDPEVGSVQPTPYRLCACDQGPRADQQDQSLERPLWLRLSVKCRKFPDIYGYWGCWLGSGCGILLPYTGQFLSESWLVCSPGGGSPEETRPVLTKAKDVKASTGLPATTVAHFGTITLFIEGAPASTIGLVLFGVVWLSVAIRLPRSPRLPTLPGTHVNTSPACVHGDTWTR